MKQIFALLSKSNDKYEDEKHKQPLNSTSRASTKFSIYIQRKKII